ncbi:hypothetical protein BDZ88DRAFT_419550 [Geranomyces variabilis]|nr:hypothetical protein BDZ88DRAFT_419550 [Geranomyces variabilis]KAJ3133788.1 hypothetical protein HDU90_005626 [Geranomyces variabilis]
MLRMHRGPITAALALLLLLGFFWQHQHHAATTTIKRRTKATSVDTTPSDKVAVIIEGRPMVNFIAIVLHWRANLPLEWPVHMFVGPALEPLLARTNKLDRYLRDGSIRLTRLPATVSLATPTGYSELLCTPWLWQQLTQEHILMFQTDSVMCSNSARSPDAYLQYDYIGGPWPAYEWYPEGYFNGGLTMRKRSTMLAIALANQWTPAAGPEDMWFSQRVLDLRPDVMIPTREVAAEFAGGPMVGPRPFAVHQPRNSGGYKSQEEMEVLLQWCPDALLAGWPGVTKFETVDVWPGGLEAP